MSKIRTLLWLWTAMMTCGLASCEIETSGNGKLDGLWLLTMVDTLATEQTADVAAESMTWGFQGQLLQLREATMDYHPANILCRFDRSGNQLTVSSPVYNDRDKGDPAVENVDDLRPFGISQPEEHFTIVTLTRSHLVLKNEQLRLNLKKM